MMFCHYENILWSEFYSAQNHFSITKNIQKWFIPLFTYDIKLLLYVLKNKEGIFIDFLLFCSDYFDEFIVLMLVSPRWVIFVTGSWPVYFC